MRKLTRNRLKQFWLPVLLLVFFASIIAFWNSLSWIINGDVWRQFLSDVFPEYFPRPYVMAVKKPVVSEQDLSLADTKPSASTTIAQIQKKPRRDVITLPTISITAPIITSQTTDDQAIHGLLDSGVVLYPGSTPFGQSGQTVLLGHSAPAGWPKIKYDWVFSRINELKKGDMVVITYNYQTYYYQVVEIRVITPQAGVPEPTVGGNSLMLVTCWPPGKDLKRIVVEAALNSGK